MMPRFFDDDKLMMSFTVKKKYYGLYAFLLGKWVLQKTLGNNWQIHATAKDWPSAANIQVSGGVILD